MAVLRTSLNQNKPEIMISVLKQTSGRLEMEIRSPEKTKVKFLLLDDSYVMHVIIEDHLLQF
jgi:hypothetical protein